MGLVTLGPDLLAERSRAVALPWRNCCAIDKFRGPCPMGKEETQKNVVWPLNRDS